MAKKAATFTIVKIEAEWNNSHCSLDNVDYILPGWAILPEKFREVWEGSDSFVTITANDEGEIIDMVRCEEIKAEEPDGLGRLPEDVESVEE